MTLQQFKKLNREEQVERIKRSGALLFIRHEAGIDVVLYQIDSFYAEVWFEAEAKDRMRINCFDDTALLNDYLKEINISELRSLL